MKLTGQIVGLFVFGLLLLGAFGILVEARVGLKPSGPVPEVQTTQVPGETAAGPAEALRAGALESLQRAQTHLARGERSEATHAIDAAHRVVMVGKSTELESGSGIYKQAETGIKRTRHALQTGRESMAEKDLSGTIATLRTAKIQAIPLSPVSPGQFEGGTVIRPDGIRIGELEGIEEDAGRRTAVLQLGGYPDFLGFIDLGGKTVRVPADELIFGKDKWLGMSMVVLPGGE